MVYTESNQEQRPAVERATSDLNPERIGLEVARYGLVVVLLWIGGMKFTAYEAEGIQVFIQNSPGFAWLNHIFSVQGVSNLLGVSEIFIALLIAARPLSAWAAAVGGAMATGMFLSTLSFLVTTPGVVEPSLGFPGISVVPGQFLVKDFVLLGVSLACLGEAAQQIRSRPRS